MAIEQTGANSIATATGLSGLDVTSIFFARPMVEAARQPECANFFSLGERHRYRRRKRHMVCGGNGFNLRTYNVATLTNYSAGLPTLEEGASVPIDGFISR